MAHALALVGLHPYLAFTFILALTYLAYTLTWLHLLGLHLHASLQALQKVLCLTDVSIQLVAQRPDSV